MLPPAARLLREEESRSRQEESRLMAQQQRVMDEELRLQEEKEVQEKAQAEQEENDKLQKQASAPWWPGGSADPPAITCIVICIYPLGFCVTLTYLEFRDCRLLSCCVVSDPRSDFSK